MLETASKSIYYWRRYPSSKCYEIDENMGFRIWCSDVAPSDAAVKTAIWVHNYCPSGAQKSQRYFGKFTSSMTWCAQTCSFRVVFGTTCTNFDNCCQRYIATCGKKFLYRCTSTFSALNYCSGIILLLSQLSIRSAAHKLFRHFLTFHNF